MIARRTALGLAALALMSTAVPADAKTTLVRRSEGTVQSSFFHYSTYIASFSLTGDISFGNRTFHGTATGSASWYCCDQSPEPPVVFHGSSPDGDLDATCFDGTGMWDATPTAGQLVCMGRVGDGPFARTRLLVVLPKASVGPAPYRGDLYKYSGFFRG